MQPRKAPSVLAAFLLASLGAVALARESAPAAVTTSPPPETPIARGEHPRLFFTADDLPALRNRIKAHYAREFQDFIDLLNDPSGVEGKKGSEVHWGSLNYAFVAALDPQELRTRGFRFRKELDTAGEYCDRAAVEARKLLGEIGTGDSIGHAGLSRGFPIARYFPVAAAYDWCYPYLSDADKKDIVDAFVSAYRTTWQGRDFRTAHGRRGMLGNNQETAFIHNTLGILAFHGDPYPSRELQAELYGLFHTVWIDRLLGELDYFYSVGTGWHEGTGGYLQSSMLNLGIPVAMFSSALATDYFATMPFFYRYPVFLEANVMPQSTLSACGKKANERCPELLERWGVIGKGIGAYGCKSILLFSGMLRKSGHANAALAKWAHGVTAANPKRDVEGCREAVTRYGSLWSNAVLYWFLFGDREVTARSAGEMEIDTSLSLGLGQYVLRTGYDPAATRVVFWATPWDMYGHLPRTQGGMFTLYKFGHLVLFPANSKSGAGEIKGAGLRGALFRNMVGIHRGASDPNLGFDGPNQIDPYFAGRGIKQINDAGRLLAEDIGSGRYDYLAHDHSVLYAKDTADVAQRELVYLRGPLNGEYLVIFDRVRVGNPAEDEKLWNIWVPAQPAFENGTAENPREGKWSSTNTDTMSMTNQFTSLGWFAPTHGKFFLKTLLPENPRISVFGGPGKEFQSADDNGSTPWGAPAMSQTVREYLGWGRIEIRPSVATSYDAFLNVIQFGDSKTLSAMTPLDRVTSKDGKLTGVHVRDARNQWIVLFASGAEDRSSVESAAYSFRPIANGSRHLLLNLRPSTRYHVSTAIDAAGTHVTASTTVPGGGTPVTTSAEGVLELELDGPTVTAPAAARRAARVSGP